MILKYILLILVEFSFISCENEEIESIGSVYKIQ